MRGEELGNLEMGDIRFAYKDDTRTVTAHVSRTETDQLVVRELQDVAHGSLSGAPRRRYF